jgi:hypothetical protein
MAQFVPAEHALKVTASAAIAKIGALLAIRSECRLVISAPLLAHPVRSASRWAITSKQVTKIRARQAAKRAEIFRAFELFFDTASLNLEPPLYAGRNTNYRRAGKTVGR